MKQTDSGSQKKEKENPNTPTNVHIVYRTLQIKQIIFESVCERVGGGLLFGKMSMCGCSLKRPAG